MKNIKQVIVMIRRFPDGKGGTFSLRLGKSIAQGSHSSLAFLVNRIKEIFDGIRTPDHYMNDEGFDNFGYLNINLDMLYWMENGFTKICCQVENEAELMEIYDKAKLAKLEVNLIKDSGKTEFKEPTITCLCIGPNESEEIDKITGHLKLL